MTLPSAEVLALQQFGAGGRVASRYQIRERLGSGGSGDVFRAHDETTGLDVAIKVFFPGPRRRDRERVRRELELVRSLRHRGVLQLFDMGEAEGLVFTVAELLEGETLRDRLVRGGPLDEETARRILTELLEGLACAHEAGIVHRDIKPSNVFLVSGPDGGIDRVVLIDFGLARNRSEDALTTVGRYMGTPAYSSPEQIRGESPRGPESDLYSVGVLLWEMVAGAPPFQGDSDADVMAAHLGRDASRRLSALRGVSPGLRLLVLRLLAKDPALRPPSAAAALELVGSGSSGTGAGPRLALLWKRLAAAPGKRSAVAAVCLAASVLALGAGYAGLPASVSAEGGRIVMRSLAGFTVRRVACARPVVAVAREGSWRGWLGHCFAALAPPAGPDAAGAHAVHEVRSMFASPEPVASTRGLYRRRVFPGVATPFKPSALHLVRDRRRARDGAPVLVLVSKQDPLYPLAIDLVMSRSLNASSPVVSFYHPGHSRTIEVVQDPETGERRMVFLAINNLAGHRLGVGSIPLSRGSQGQAPPFAAPLRHVPPATGWYNFVPHAGYDGRASLRIVGGQAVVEPAGGEPVAYDVTTGVPVDARHRGGLLPAAWQDRAAALRDALIAAARAGQSGRPGDAAGVLEELAAAPDLPDEMAAVALYEAARARQRSAEGRRGEALVTALDDIDQAIGREPSSPPRYRLLQAELLARLGDVAALDAVLTDWGGRYDESMHAYDWLLIDWLAGGEKPLEFFFAGWPADERRTSNWALLLDLVHGYRSGDHGPGLERLAAWPRPESTWAEHHYWAARSLLERAEPEPAKALEEIARGRSKIALSRYLPIEALRLRAEGMSGRQRLTAASFDGALEGLRRLAERSGSDIRAMTFLPLAARDLARAAGLAGQAQLAGEIEREFLKTGSARRIVGPGPSIGGGAEVRSRNIGGR